LFGCHQSKNGAGSGYSNQPKGKMFYKFLPVHLFIEKRINLSFDCHCGGGSFYFVVVSAFIQSTKHAYVNTKEKRPVYLIFFLWWLLPDSNWGHKALQASALPTELKSRNGWSILNCTVLPLAIGLPLLYEYLRFTQELKSRNVGTSLIVNYYRKTVGLASALRYLRFTQELKSHSSTYSTRGGLFIQDCLCSVAFYAYFWYNKGIKI
jgi:hypothetical protein